MGLLTRRQNDKCQDAPVVLRLQYVYIYVLWNAEPTEARSPSRRLLVVFETQHPPSFTAPTPHPSDLLAGTHIGSSWVIYFVFLCENCTHNCTFFHSRWLSLQPLLIVSLSLHVSIFIFPSLLLAHPVSSSLALQVSPQKTRYPGSALSCFRYIYVYVFLVCKRRITCGHPQRRIQVDDMSALVG